MDRNRARIAGAGAAAVALGVLWLISGIDARISFPPVALADAFIRIVPGDVTTFMIEALGHWAMRLLSLAAVVVTVGVGGEALARSSRSGAPRPVVAAGLLAAVGVLAAVVDPSSGRSVAGSIVAVLVAAGAYAGAARLVLGRTEPEVAVDASRRRALGFGLAGVATAAAGTGALGWLVRRLGGPNTDVEIAKPVVRATVPARAGFPDIPGLTPEVTSARDHYVVDINLIAPSVEADGWTLSVAGEVEEPLVLTFSGLQERFEVVEEYSVLTCVSNEVGGNLIGHSAWGGVRLKDVLAAAAVHSDAVDVVFRAADGYSDSIPLERALDPHALLAVSQNGAPLTQEHGFPCRVRIPAIFGMKNVKWLQSIEVVGSDYQGYWQRRGWSDVAIVDTQSRVDVAGDDFSARAGEATWIAGVAWAGDRGISRVEVSTDAGNTWSDARLKDPISDISWRLWAYRWTPAAPGDAAVTCRATDGAGELQVVRIAPPHPDGATGYHSVRVAVS